MMPEMDGIEVCKELRLKPEYQDAIIIFLTARGEDYSQIAGLESGGDDYLTKPISPRVLISRIKAILRRSSKAEQARQLKVFGDLSIDKEQVVVMIKDKEINLAKKEFELIDLLSSKPGKVFTRAEIFDKVWGYDLIVGERTIDVHIRKIREKIGDHYIKTVKGMGYKFYIE
ncbi:UNVERIFIED_CONTAM: hypothetical protein GTU68_057904 [Idotea baltica]|nr:hypothetical protein [Idotea baltica]